MTDIDHGLFKNTFVDTVLKYVLILSIGLMVLNGLIHFAAVFTTFENTGWTPPPDRYTPPPCCTGRGVFEDG